MNPFRKHDGKQNWRMTLAFLLAGEDLHDWRSKHNRIVAKMATSLAIGEAVKKLNSDEAFDIVYSYGDGGAEDVIAGLINLVKGEQK